MTDPVPDLPKQGELVTIRWPDGPYDFEIEFGAVVDDDYQHEPGWMFFSGSQTKPEGPGHRCWRILYVHQVDGHWSLLPKLP